MGAAFWGPLGTFFEKNLIGKAIAGYALGTITNKLFGKKIKASSPTYSFGALQTQANSNLVMPIIYGKIKCAGNDIWQSPEGTTVQRLVGFGIGKNKGVSEVRLDDKPIGELPGCSYTAYMGDGEQAIDSRVGLYYEMVDDYAWVTHGDGEPVWTKIGSHQEVRYKSQGEMARIVGGLKYDAYLALTLQASDKLSGNPNVTAIWEGRIVRIYDTPTTYHEAWSDNVWCILDFMMSVDGCDIPESAIDIQSFITAAAYCQPGNGARNWSINLILDEKKSRQDWLNEMLLTFRAFRTYQHGKHGILIDKPEPVSQVFKVKPTETIQIDWQELSEDIERLIIKYPAPDYEWQFVGASATINPPFRKRKPLEKVIEIVGITNFKQGSQHAWFYLNQAQTCDEYITYTCNKRALNRTIGDVVGIFNPITQVTEPGLPYKRYRIMAMTEPQGMQIQMYCRAYNEAIYTDQLGSVAPVVNVTKLPNPALPPPNVTGLALSQTYYRQGDGTIVSYITGTCVFPDSALFGSAVVYYSEDNGTTWHHNGTISVPEFVINNVKTGITYLVRVKSASRVSPGIFSSGVTSLPIHITGKDSPPSNVSALTAVIDLADRTKITLTWPEVDDIDLRGYRLSEGSTILTPTPISDTRYVYTATSTRQHIFTVVAIDNSGNLSTTPAKVTLAVTVEPPHVTGFTAIPQETDRSQLILNWAAVQAQDLSYYEIRQGENGWDAATLIATQLKSTRYVHQLNTEGYQTYMVKAYAVGGHASALAVSLSLQVTLRPDAPTNLAALQEPRDKSMLKISWTASTGKDLAGYDIFVGAIQITTEKNTSHWWTIPASGSYTIAVRARTVAGYISNAVNVTVSPMIEADDVTGFTASQQISDRTRVRLMWDASDGDVAYHEIRKGVSWDAGEVIGKRVTGTFFDTFVLDESVQTYWIKAVTTAGKYSQNPAMIEGLFNLNPSPVSNIVLAQDPNDRSILNITFEATPESDLANYEIRVGYVWQDATVIGKTKELRWTYSPPATGDVKVMIKAVNAAGFLSDETSANRYCTLEPGNVTGFRVFQNGEKLAFVWNPVSDNDVVGYELREGGNYDNGTIVATGITLTQYQLAVDTEILRRFHVKAINLSGHYSQVTASKSVLITDLPPKNVIQTYDEIALQSGTHDGTEFGESLITFATLPGTFADYPTTKFSDIGGAVVLKLAQVGGIYPVSGLYTCARKDMGQVITANIAAVFQPSILYTAGTTASLEYRTSRDEATWTDWTPFSPLEVTFRYADFRVILTTADTMKTPEVNQLLIRVDVPDKDIAKSVIVPVGGITVEYGHTYYELPVVNPTAEGTVGRAVWSNKTKETVDLHVIDTDTGVDIGGNVDLRVKGY